MYNFINMLRCPFCRSGLEYYNENLCCSICRKIFNDSGILNLCNENLLSTKKGVIDFFSDIAAAINQTEFSRFITFQNWGYSGDIKTSLIKVSKASNNYNSLLLLSELLGNIDLNNKKVIDVGCGRGGVISFINKHFNPSLVVGIDITRPSIEFCISHIKNVQFIMADAENLPFKDESFDCLINIESASDYPDIERFYRNAYCILEHGGVMLHADVFPACKIDAYESYLLSCGFILKQKRDITSNVLMSIVQTQSNYTETFKKTAIMDKIEFKDTMGLPGTKIYNEMHSKERKYILYTLAKP